MNAIILKCPTNGRFHFGVTAPDNDSALSNTSECFHSDTLFSALVVTCNKVFPRKVSVLIDYLQSGAVKISSGNYCLDIFEHKTFKKRLYFLPKPSHFGLLGRNHADRKTFKSVRYISKTIWEKGLHPKDWDSNYIIDKKFLVHPEDLLVEEVKKMKGLYSKNTEPKIADHARKKEDNIYFQTDLLLKTSKLKNRLYQPHFYFLIDYGEEQGDIVKLMNFLISIIPDEGLGGAISTGCGRILTTEEVKDWVINFQEVEKISPTHKVSLSLIALCDKKPEELEDFLYGDPIVRGGRVIGKGIDKESNEEKLIKLKRIRMIREGALIKEKVVGRIAELYEHQPFLRYGMAFPLPIHENFVK